MTFEIPASATAERSCDEHGPHLGLHCPACIEGQLTIETPAPPAADTTGSRGGTTESFNEAEELLEKSSELAAVKGQIVQMAARYGRVHADHIADGVRNEQVIGTAFGVLVREGLIVEKGRRKSARKSTHGRKSGEYALTDDGWLMARALGYADAA